MSQNKLDILEIPGTAIKTVQSYLKNLVSTQYTKKLNIACLLLNAIVYSLGFDAVEMYLWAAYHAFSLHQ